MNRLAMSFLLLSSMSAPVLAESAIKVKAHVSISAATISLADLLDHASNQTLPNTPLFASPEPGESGLINIERVRGAAKHAGLVVEENPGVQSVIVTRTGRILDHQMLIEQLSSLIAKNSQNTSATITVTHDTWPRMITVELDSHALVEFRNLVLDPSRAQYDADLFIADSPSLARRSIHMSGHYDISTLCTSARRNLKKGEIITSADIITEKCSLKNKTQEPAKPERLIGFAIIDDINAGTLLDTQLVTKPILVEKGAQVVLSYRVGGLALTLRGRANESGALGDMISITHSQSKKPIDATVTGRGSVEINDVKRASLARIDTIPSTEQGSAQ